MKKKFYSLLAICVAVFAVFYAFDSHIVGSASANGSPYKFYYKELDKTEKRAYDCILDKIYEMPEKIRVPYLSEEQLDNVFMAILYDNPDLFFLGRKCSVTSGFMTDYFSVDYIMDKQEYRKQEKELERVKREIVAGLSDSEDEWQLEKEIHDYIVDNCDYKIVEKDYSYSSAYGALVNKTAACEGYSKAAKLLLDEVKIENGIVCGVATSQKNETSSHMWNAVKINGKFYHLDCTWDDPVNDNGAKMRMYSYFNVSDEMISASHKDFSFDYKCYSDEENYYIKNGMYFTQFGKNEKKLIKEKMIECVENGEKYVQMRFSSKNLYKTAVSDLIKKSNIYSILTDVKKATGKNIATNVMKYYENDMQYILTIIVE